MVANITGHEVGAMMIIHRGRLGHLLSPSGRAKIYSWQPYSLDNECFPGEDGADRWDVDNWRDMLRWACLSGIPPLWALVPDVPFDAAATLERWKEYAPEVARYGFKLAFAAQNGMTPADVPAEAHTIFLGGDDEWKDAAIRPWCAAFPGRVHVGRVNGFPRLLAAHNAGAASVDGTGWFTKSNNKTGGQWAMLVKYLRETA
jgi:hypothetical protein